MNPTHGALHFRTLLSFIHVVSHYRYFLVKNFFAEKNRETRNALHNSNPKILFDKEGASNAHWYGLGCLSNGLYGF